MFTRLSSFICAILLLALCGCGAPPATSAPSAVGADGRPPLLVAAASDLQTALPEIVALYKQQTGQDVTLTFGSTGALSQQIENGAPYDIFMAADVSYIDALKAKDLIIADTAQLYGQGRIVLAFNKQSGLAASVGAQFIAPLQAASLAAALTNPAVKQIAIANPDHAPYGKAAMQAMQAAGIWDQVKPKLVYGENITQARQYIQTGDAPAGIVALSIANVSELTSTLIDAKLHDPLNQMMAALRQTKQPAAARAFVTFVNGPQGRTILKKYGFALPGEL